MTHQLPPDDRPRGPGLVPVSHSLAAGSLPNPPTLQTPLGTAVLFMTGLWSGDPRKYLTALRNMTTPESRNAWGDFIEAAHAAEGCGIASGADHPVDDNGEPITDVAYVKLPRDVSNDMRVDADLVMMPSLILTLVWRPEYGEWRVHSLGPVYLLPHDVPRMA